MIYPSDSAKYVPLVDSAQVLKEAVSIYLVSHYGCGDYIITDNNHFYPPAVAPVIPYDKQVQTAAIKPKHTERKKGEKLEDNRASWFTITMG